MLMTREFLKVTDLDQVLAYRTVFPPVGVETIDLNDAVGRVLAAEVTSDIDLPDFVRATMDGYAVRASSTFGASEENPAYLALKGDVVMGGIPDFQIDPAETARISTGGMLPEGADSVVMVEHTQIIDPETIEVHRSVAPGQNIIEVGEDLKKQAVILTGGQKIRAQEAGLLAALGQRTVTVFQRPVVGIISTGDEVVAVDEFPGRGQIRDVNTYTLSGLVRQAGAVPVSFGIVRDDYDALFDRCAQALSRSDMLLISGGSSVGTRDFTVDVLSALPEPQILAHGVSISPGKPTILARSKHKAIWGLPGHVVSAMVVFVVLVRPFIDQIQGYLSHGSQHNRISAVLARNIASAQGRTDFIRIRLVEQNGTLRAEPILGKSGLIHTMLKADGLIEIDKNTEGLDEGAQVLVMPI
ncbi:MAG: molybdopterin molybdotransferase MoeA [Desulfobacterales bacterium]|nr:molybdopterin molybdotransferase MoeA [Desulfobacterales bacterium]